MSLLPFWVASKQEQRKNTHCCYLFFAKSTYCCLATTFQRQNGNATDHLPSMPPRNTTLLKGLTDRYASFASHCYNIFPLMAAPLHSIDLPEITKPSTASSLDVGCCRYDPKAPTACLAQGVRKTPSPIWNGSTSRPWTGDFFRGCLGSNVFRTLGACLGEHSELWMSIGKLIWNGLEPDLQKLL